MYTSCPTLAASSSSRTLVNSPLNRSTDSIGRWQVVSIEPTGIAARVAEGRSILIFPEGTRVAVGDERPYHFGTAALYRQLGVPVVPVALNSGLFWGRRKWVKRPGVIDVEILPPIAPGLSREAFMATLRERIETATARLVAKAS